MTSRIVLSLFLLLGRFAAVGAHEEPCPQLPPPQFASVEALDEERQEVILIEYAAVSASGQLREVKPGDSSSGVRIASPTKFSQYRFLLPLRDVQAFTAGGTELPTEGLAKRLQRGTTVLISSHGKMPDRAYLSLFKTDTLILVVKESKPK